MNKIKINFSSSFWEKILHIFFPAYLFLLILPRVTTVREIVFWIAVFCWVMIRFRRRAVAQIEGQEPFIPLNPVTVSLSIFMLIALTASVTGMQPVDNLNRFKGELLTPFILFFVAATEFRSLEKIKIPLFALILAFAIYTLLTVIESTSYGFRYYWDKTNREQYFWLSTGYWQRGALIFPVILGTFLIIKNSLIKYSLITLALTEFAVIAAYRSFMVFTGIISVLLLWLLFIKNKKYRRWMAGFISLFIVIFGMLFYIKKDNPAISEYREKLGKTINISREFKSEIGFSNRMPLWHAAADIIKDRPLLGYGWGMKKFTKLVQQEKFLENWRVNQPDVYKFIVTYKDVFFPPHNMFLEIAIQSGLLGLAAFIAFIGIYASYLVRRVLRTESDAGRNFFIIIVGGVLLSFLITNLMNNELGNISGKILFVILGLSMAKKD
ncbi:MAG: O-antigen ligase family protein [Nitrospirae bacterium]|nr:O-antigen ligase family protein [Nitrospirota bacterium]